jgi:hypothetical protein
MNNRELFGPSLQVAHGPGFQYVNGGFRANRAVSRDATFCKQQYGECKCVGDNRSKILGKLLKNDLTGEGSVYRAAQHRHTSIRRENGALQPLDSQDDLPDSANQLNVFALTVWP